MELNTIIIIIAFSSVIISVTYGAYQIAK